MSAPAGLPAGKFATRDTYEDLQQRLGYLFNNRALLQEACDRGAEPRPCGLSLANLGRAVLQQCVHHALFERLRDASKAEMTARSDELLGDGGLAGIGRTLGLPGFLACAVGTAAAAAASSDAALADGVRALIGAVFNDPGGGLDAAQLVVDSLLFAGTSTTGSPAATAVPATAAGAAAPRVADDLESRGGPATAAGPAAFGGASAAAEWPDPPTEEGDAVTGSGGGGDGGPMAAPARGMPADGAGAASTSGTTGAYRAAR